MSLSSNNSNMIKPVILRETEKYINFTMVCSLFPKFYTIYVTAIG